MSEKMFISPETEKAFMESNTEFGKCVVAGTVKVEFCDLSESLFGGDYDPENPEDVSVLRFDGSAWDNSEGWVELEDSSYCTSIPVDTPKEKLHKALQLIADEYLACVESGASVKRIGEKLSWIKIE